MQKNVFMFGVLLLGSVFLAGCGSRFAPAPAEARTVEVGVLLRKQFTDDIRKKRHYRHVHAVLADGSLISFNNSIYDYPTWKSLIFTTPGEVQDNARMRVVRKHYMSAEVAKDCTYKGRPHQKIVTDWVRFRVTPEQAAALAAEWQKLAANTPRFRLFGRNCSTYAYQCFARAGILPGTIPGIDRPENMMGPIYKYYPDHTRETGWFGVDANDRPYIEPIPRDGF